MERARFLRVKQLFQQALGLPDGEREAFVEQACEGDPELANEVRDLLGHARSASGGFLEGASGASAGPGPARLRVPGFEILERLAVGASGAVYRAQQAHPRREVALKVLRADSLGPGQVARFRREAQILAGLDHPGIARVIESGVLEDGTLALPWIALEFVRGLTLDRFVAEAGLDLRGRLELFAALCDAVEHAHVRGIVHRDLKPSNVMVDAEGRPRVLDFGVARAPLELDGATALRTRTGMLIGTLGFMAPEQARGEREPTPAADVYSLGVMLFELLTGHLPIEIDERELLDAAQAICDEEPLALRRLRPDLPQDLETVLAKALEKDPARRYRSAGQLAEELRRFLARRPVLARRATVIYRVGKLVRRHPALFGSLTVVVVVLATALAFALVFLHTARRESARSGAVIEAFATQMVELTSRLGFGEPQRGNLEAVLALVEEQLERTPDSRRLRAARAELLTDLAVLDQAQGDSLAMGARLLEARGLWEGLGRQDPSDLQAWTRLSATYARLGEFARAQGRLDERDGWDRRALELDERLVREHPGDLELVEDLGWSLERVARARAEAGDRDEALRLDLRRLADAEDLVRREPENWKYVFNLSHCRYYLAGLCFDRGDLEQADRHSDQSVRLARRLLELQPARRDALQWLVDACLARCDVLHARGAGAAAGAFASEALDRAVELLVADPTRPDHLDRLTWAAQVLALNGAPLDQVPSARNVIDRLQRVASLVELQGHGQVAETLRTMLTELESQALER